MFINNLIILFFCLIFFSCSINNGDNNKIADNKNINSKIDTNNNSVSDYAKENNNDEEQDIIIEISYIGKWRGYDVYEPMFESEEVAFVGLPYVILVKEDEIRMSTPKESLEQLNEMN